MRKLKPCLALSATILFGSIFYRAGLRNEIRMVSVIVIVNAILCHIIGCVQWDIACNAALVVLVLLTSRHPDHVLRAVAVAGTIWWANHMWIDSSLLHMLCVQGVGAYILSNWGV